MKKNGVAERRTLEVLYQSVEHQIFNTVLGQLPLAWGQTGTKFQVPGMYLYARVHTWYVGCRNNNLA